MIDSISLKIDDYWSRGDNELINTDRDKQIRDGVKRKKKDRPWTVFVSKY